MLQSEMHSLARHKDVASNPQLIGLRAFLLAKRETIILSHMFLCSRNVSDTKPPYPTKRLEVIR